MISGSARPTPRRLVSLCPSVTELVFALGRGDRLVGVSRWCTHPPEGVAGIERVGGTKDPDLARIVELAPDLVLLNREENRLEDADTLAAAGLRLHAGHPRNPEETAQMVRELGRLLDADTAAASLADRIERTADRVRSRGAARTGPAPRFAILIWRKPWMAAGGGTFLGAMLETAGGRNVFSGSQRPYPEVTADELRAADPDRVLLTSEPFPFGPAHRDELHRATGLAAERFRFTDGRLLSWHGASTPDGLELAADLVEEASARRARSEREPG